jgi:hypothetical protein
LALVTIGAVAAHFGPGVVGRNLDGSRSHRSAGARRIDANTAEIDTYVEVLGQLPSVHGYSQRATSPTDG